MSTHEAAHAGRGSQERRLRSIVIAGVMAAVTLLTLAAAPANAAPPSATEHTSSAIQTTIIDPTTGQEVMVAFTQSVQASTAGALGIEGLAEDYACKSIGSAYIIYFSVPYYRELLRWNFSHTWCWERRLVVSASASDARTFKDPTIKVTGSFQKTIGPVNRLTTRVKFEGAHFEYCPIVGASVVCFGNFDPIIDLTLYPNGNWTDATQLA